MKITILLILCLLSFFNSFGQKDTLIRYFDEDWLKTKKSKAVYYRKLYETEQDLWAVTDYFLDGQIQMEGHYTSKKAKTRTGTFTFYNKNGTIERTGNYDERGKKTGKWSDYDSSGILDFETLYTEDSIRTEYFHINGKIAAIETIDIVKKDTIEVFFHEDGSPLKSNEKGWYEPEFPGGVEAMTNFILSHTKYPEKSVQLGQQGTSYVKFVVEKDGSLSNFRITKSSYPRLDDEAMRVVKSMPNWIPGKAHNRLARYNFTLPIEFRLG